MLIGISPLIGPDLLSTLHRMGHGDEIVLADAHFPGESFGRRVIRADSPLIMMAAVAGDRLDPAVATSYRAVVDKHWPGTPPVGRIDRFTFYERAQEAFAVVMTGETAKYGNIILKKGVTPA
jgi:L-fucose mutarotase